MILLPTPDLSPQFSASRARMASWPQLKRPGDIFAIVLAAGTASRFGATKQTRRVGMACRSLRRAMAASCQCGLPDQDRPGGTGHDWRAVTACLRPCAGAFVVYSEDYAAGIGTSLAIAPLKQFGMRRMLSVVLALLPISRWSQPNTVSGALLHLERC